MSKILTLVIASASIAFAAPPPAAAAPDGDPIYMQIAGIPGEVTERTHAGWIEIATVAWGKNGRAASATAEQRAKIHDIVITKRVDKASPKLEQAADTEKHFYTVRIQNIDSAGHIGTDMTLHDAVISSFKLNAKGDHPTETLIFSFTSETEKTH